MTDWLEQSLIDLGLGWKESYDCYIQSGLPARSYTRQKYRKKMYAWLTIGRHLKHPDVYEEGSFSVWPRRLLKSKTNHKGRAEIEARKLFSVYHINKYRILNTHQEEIPVKHRQKKSQATTPDS